MSDWPTIEWLATRTGAADAAVPRAEAEALLARLAELEALLAKMTDHEEKP